MRYAGTLEIATPSEVEIVVARRFAAPRSLIFEALSRPELLVQWLGPPAGSVTLCHVDLRVGGEWHLVWRDGDGNEAGTRGVFREIGRPGWLVHTESSDEWVPGEALVSTSLLPWDDGTRLTRGLRFPSRQARDTMLEPVYRQRLSEAFDRLAQLLAALSRRDPPRLESVPAPEESVVATADELSTPRSARGSIPVESPRR
jgi:uncharacterized protein YndB with AHSA1/START domain